MKRLGFIFEKIADKNNIERAIYNYIASRKTAWAKKRAREKFLPQIKIVVDEIVARIERGYLPSKPHQFERYDKCSKKKRLISSYCALDNIVQTAIAQVVEPILNKRLHHCVCCNIKGKGGAYVKKYLQKWIKKEYRKEKAAEKRGEKYRNRCKNVLKFDIKKYYENIDHACLRAKLERVFKDKKAIDLIMAFVATNGERGLCIGGRISHTLANFYLCDFDKKICEDSASEYYSRYMDDVVVFGRNKSKLHALRARVCAWLGKIGLALKHTWYVAPLKKRDCDYVGFRFLHDGVIKIRKRIRLNILRAIKKFKIDALASYLGWAYCATKEFKLLTKIRKII